MFTTFFQECFSDFYHGYYYCILPIAMLISAAYYKGADKVFRWICVLIILTCISEFTALYFKSNKWYNGIVYNIFTPIEYYMYANIYCRFLNNKKWSKRLWTSFAFLITAEILNILFLQNMNMYPTNIIKIESVLLVYLSLQLFESLRDKPVYENILREGVFWFNSAVLFYYSFDILTSAFYDIMPSLAKPEKINGHMLLLFSGLLYITFTTSILINNSAVKNPLRRYASALPGSR